MESKREVSIVFVAWRGRLSALISGGNIIASFILEYQKLCSQCIFCCTCVCDTKFVNVFVTILLLFRA